MPCSRSSAAFRVREAAALRAGTVAGGWAQLPSRQNFATLAREWERVTVRHNFDTVVRGWSVASLAAEERRAGCRVREGSHMQKGRALRVRGTVFHWKGTWTKDGAGERREPWGRPFAVGGACQNARGVSAALQGWRPEGRFGVIPREVAVGVGTGESVEREDPSTTAGSSAFTVPWGKAAKGPGVVRKVGSKRQLVAAQEGGGERMCREVGQQRRVRRAEVGAGSAGPASSHSSSFPVLEEELGFGSPGLDSATGAEATFQ